MSNLILQSFYNDLDKNSLDPSLFQWFKIEKVFKNIENTPVYYIPVLSVFKRTGWPTYQFIKRQYICELPEPSWPLNLMSKSWW